MSGPIYLDHNATTPIDPLVLDEMHRCQLQFGANPASPHELGRRARRRLEQAREEIGQLLGLHQSDVQGDRVIFTSGGTEANNLALLGLHRRGRAVWISSIEHPSVLAASEVWRRRGELVEQLPVDTEGRLVWEPQGLAELPEPGLVSVMLGNNETGVLQPVEAIAVWCRSRDVLCHTDAVQVIGKMPVDFHRLGVDAMSFTGHKFHGPQGIGALVLRSGVDLQPQLHGGFQQEGLRPGTEPVALAVGLATALRLFHEQAEARRQQLQQLRDTFEELVTGQVPLAIVLGKRVARLPHTSSIAFPGIDRQALLMALDMAGVCCSAGSACASGSSEPSPALVAMGLPADVVESALRFSLGATTTGEQIRRAAERIGGAVERLSRLKPRQA